MNNLTQGESHKVGELLLGTWTKELHDFLKSNIPYKKIFRSKSNRNFHTESFTVQDLKYEKLFKKLKDKLEILYDFL